MSSHIRDRKIDEFLTIMKRFIANIPYELHMKGERYYQNIFYFIFTLIGLRLNAEVHTNIGRIDAVLELKDDIFIFEMKLDKSAEEALKQIKERKYYEKYDKDKFKIYKVGVNFSTKDRNLDGWIIES